jgi:hypothetical protein
MQQVRNTFKIKMPSRGVGMRMPPAQPNFPARIPSPTMPSMRAPYAELPVMRAMHRGGDIEKDGLYPLQAGERVIPRGAADAKVKIKASGTDAMRVLAGETIPAGLRSRSVRKNAYYDPDGGVNAAHKTPHDRTPMENTGSNPGVEETMHEFKEGTLRSGSAKGPKVRSRKQAIAIALSQAGKSKKSKKR